MVERHCSARRRANFSQRLVNTKVHPYAWHPSVVYDAPLGVYLMANWGMAARRMECGLANPVISASGRRHTVGTLDSIP